LEVAALKLGQGFTLKTDQRLMLTPQMQQFLFVLQMTVVELESYLEKQLEENCLLELDEGRESAALTAYADSFREPVSYVAEAEGGVDVGELVPAAPPSLYDVLIAQLRQCELDELEFRAAELLIRSIDDDGFLRCDLRDISVECGLPMAEVAKTLQLVQTFEPAGVGARSLEECLLLQLDSLEIDSAVATLARELIENYLGELARGSWRKLLKALGCSPEALQAAVELIRSLEPKPGRRFDTRNYTSFVFPDATIHRVEGEYLITVHEPINARLIVNPVYERLLQNGQVGDPVKEFLRGRLEAAVRLLSSLEQRRLTMFKIAAAIVEIQKDFLERGLQYLKPMTLEDVAQLVQVHPSTVSRAVAGKYLATPWGVYSFGRLFTSGVSLVQGGEISSAQVKELIKRAIEQEDPADPLSDERLANLLAEQGIAVSRRTVVKYRQQLHIPSSRQRRRL